MYLSNFINIEEFTVYNWFILIVLILSGLGLFLYGINKLSNSLKNIVGDKLKIIIQKRKLITYQISTSILVKVLSLVKVRLTVS